MASNIRVFIRGSFFHGCFWGSSSMDPVMEWSIPQVIDALVERRTHVPLGISAGQRVTSWAVTSWITCTPLGSKEHHLPTPYLLGQWLNLKLFGITYLVGKIKFKLKTFISGFHWLSEPMIMCKNVNLPGCFSILAWDPSDLKLFF